MKMPPLTTSTAPSLGDLAGLDPIDPLFGGGRGRPIDRHCIEGLLQRHRADIRGTTLEVADDQYTRRYGGTAVLQADVLHVEAGHPGATVVADLALGEGIATARYDCFICTQTLQYVFDLPAAVRTIHRLLRPGGVLLLTVPGISQISPYDRERWGEYWRFTPQSVQRLLAAAFDDVQVQGWGNVLVATAFLQGLACEDLTAQALDHHDDRYPVLVTARAVRQG